MWLKATGRGRQTQHVDGSTMGVTQNAKEDDAVPGPLHSWKPRSKWDLTESSPRNPWEG